MDTRKAQLHYPAIKTTMKPVADLTQLDTLVDKRGTAWPLTRVSRERDDYTTVWYRGHGAR